MIDDNVMRKLGYFVMLSVCMHIWLLYGVPLELPRFEAAPPVLEARLQPAPPLPPVLPRAHPPPRHRAPPPPFWAGPAAPTAAHIRPGVAGNSGTHRTGAD
jgi:hypothetical protein